MPMTLTKMEERCKQLEDYAKQLQEHLANREKLESEAKEKNMESQMLREIARMRGEEPPAEPKLDALEKTKKEIETLQSEIEKLSKDIYDGMKDILLPIPKEIPQVNPEGNSTLLLEAGPYGSAVRFIAATIDSDVPLELDKTRLFPEKIVIAGIRNPSEVIERLRRFRDDIGRLARIALREQDDEVEKVVNSLAESDYRDLWEAIRGRKRISYDEIYAELSISDEKDRRRVRNFFINLEKQLGEKFPFIRIDSGTYELSFFGSLVWKRYSDKCGVTSLPTGITAKTEDTKGDSKDESKETSTPPLNNYLSPEDRKVIYGKEDK